MGFINFTVYIIAFLAVGSQCLWAAPPTQVMDLSGIYEVTRATLNVNNCEKEGKPTNYASRYLSVSGHPESGYNLAICNGESLDELDCPGGYRATHLKQQIDNGWYGYRYTARKGMSIKNLPICRLHSARRKIIAMGKGFLRYERTDKAETLSDFIAECSRSMAALYTEAQSLKCTTHIVVFANRVNMPISGN